MSPVLSTCFCRFLRFSHFLIFNIILKQNAPNASSSPGGCKIPVLASRRGDHWSPEGLQPVKVGGRLIAAPTHPVGAIINRLHPPPGGFCSIICRQANVPPYGSSDFPLHPLSGARPISSDTVGAISRIEKEPNWLPPAKSGPRAKSGIVISSALSVPWFFP